MTIITVILFSSIIIPFISGKSNKKMPALISWLLLFFIWAFQYEMSKDWLVYLSRWKMATLNVKLQENELEPIYTVILKICEPFTYFGYLILSATFSISVLKKYIDKYIPNNLSWMFFLTFSIGCGYFLEFVNTNRQTIAIMFVMIAIYILSNPYKTNKKIYWSISAFLIFVAFNIHRSAVITIPVLLFPLIIHKIHNTKYLYIFLVINLLSFLIDYDRTSEYLGVLMVRNEEFNAYSHYTNEITERSKSIIEQSIFTISLFLFIYNFDKFKSNEKPLILATIIYLSLQGFAMYTMLRVLSYYKIFFAISIPILYSKTYNISKPYKYLSQLMITLYAIYMTYRYSIDIQGVNYEGYTNFRTLFDAEKWI